MYHIIISQKCIKYYNMHLIRPTNTGPHLKTQQYSHRTIVGHQNLQLKDLTTHIKWKYIILVTIYSLKIFKSFSPQELPEYNLCLPS